MNNTIKQASGLLVALWNSCKPSQFLHIVVTSADQEMDEYDDVFCQECIKYAIDNATADFHNKRLQEFGKIYELRKNGFYLDVKLKRNEFGEPIGGVEIKKIKQNPQETRAMEEWVMEKYKLKTDFFSKSYSTYGITQEGFRHCAMCDNIFDYQFVLTDKELARWEQSDDQHLEHCMHCKGHGYELYTVLNCVNAAGFEERLTWLARRLIELSINGNTEEY